MADDWSADLERRYLVRAVRQRLESLSRAGLDRIPAPDHREPAGRSPAGQEKPSARERELVHSRDDAEPGGRRLDPPAGKHLAAPPTGSAAAGSASGPLDGRAAAEHRAHPPGPGRHSSPTDRATSLPPLPVAASLFSSSEFETPPVPACDRAPLLDALATQVSVCRKCPHLADTRTQTVFGTGSSATRLMFIGEAPGADEDRIGQPFVGRAGQLLTDMITKGMGLARDQVYIANILKCRPPENRTPTAEESENCIGYLEEQIRNHPARVSLPAGQGRAPGAASNVTLHGEGPRQVASLPGYSDDRHISPRLPAAEAGIQARGVGRPSNAHEGDGIAGSGP